MSNVVSLEAVRPKQVKRTYRQQHYTVTFLPATKEWKWTVEVVQTTVYSDVAASQIKAFRSAEKCIDRVLKLQGVA